MAVITCIYIVLCEECLSKNVSTTMDKNATMKYIIEKRVIYAIITEALYIYIYIYIYIYSEDGGE
jgi:hypothetical protein